MHLYLNGGAVPSIQPHEFIRGGKNKFFYIISIRSTSAFMGLSAGKSHNVRLRSW